jgi:hypothetical protein
LDAFEWNDDTNYAGVIALKKQNPNLKVLLSVGGWNLDSGPFRFVFKFNINSANSLILSYFYF